METITWTVEMRSGKEIEVTNLEAKAIKIRLANSGRNFPRVELKDGSLLFLEHIERMVPNGDLDSVDIEDSKAVRPIEVEDVDGELAAKLENQKKLDEIIKKANCKHPEEDQQVYGTATKTGTKFFKACTNCGGNRTRYIAATKLSDEELKSALDWDAKE